MIFAFALASALLPQEPIPDPFVPHDNLLRAQPLAAGLKALPS